MIKVRLLTEEQMYILTGTYYNECSIFNPIQDLYDRWVLSEEEVISNLNRHLDWINDLEIIDYEPKIIDLY